MVGGAARCFLGLLGAGLCRASSGFRAAGDHRRPCPMTHRSTSPNPRREAGPRATPIRPAPAPPGGGSAGRHASQPQVGQPFCPRPFPQELPLVVGGALRPPSCRGFVLQPHSVDRPCRLASGPLGPRRRRDWKPLLPSLSSDDLRNPTTWIGVPRSPWNRSRPIPAAEEWCGIVLSSPLRMGL